MPGLSKRRVRAIEWPEPHQVRRFLGMAVDQFDVRDGGERSNISLTNFKTWFNGTQTAPRQFTVDIAEFKRVLKNLLKTTLDSAKEGGRGDRDMWKAGWYSALSSTERDVYENSVTAIYEAIHTVETEGYDCPKPGCTILTDFQQGEVLNMVEAAMTELRKLKEEVVTVRYKRGAFEIIQSSRVSDDLAMRMLRRFDLMMAALIDFGCSHLLYGRLIMNDNIGDGKWVGQGSTRRKSFTTAAHYVIQADEIQMGQHVTSGRPDFSTACLVHEMGHRHWYQGMSAQDQQRFTEEVTRPDGSLISPTKYGEKNIRECFAEWFMVYAAGYRGREVNLSGTTTMTRTKFRALCRLDEDDRLDDYIPGFARDAVLEELLRLEDTIKTYLVTLMEVPEFVQVREVIHEADGVVDSGLIATATNYADAVIGGLVTGMDAKYPKLVEPYSAYREVLISRGLKGGVIDAAIRIYCSKSVAPGRWPEPDEKLLVTREDLEREFRDVSGDEFENEYGDHHFDLRKHRKALRNKGVTSMGDITLRIIPHPSASGFTLKRETSSEEFIYEEQMSLDKAQEFALKELRRLAKEAAGIEVQAPAGTSNPVEADDLTHNNLSKPTGLSTALAYFGGATADGHKPGPRSRLFYWNKSTGDIRLTGDPHRYYRDKQKGSNRWDGGDPFVIRPGDIVYMKDSDQLVFYIAKARFNPIKAAINSIVLYLSRAGVAFRANGKVYAATSGEPEPDENPTQTRKWGRRSKKGIYTPLTPARIKAISIAVDRGRQDRDFWVKHIGAEIGESVLKALERLGLIERKYKRGVGWFRVTDLGKMAYSEHTESITEDDDGFEDE